jgi:hypothetical protein
LDLVLKDGENGGRRVAGLKLGGERMNKEILFRTLFVGVERIVYDELEIG